METFPTIEQRLEHLLSRDYLYDDPASYRAGILEAMDAYRRLRERERASA